MALQNNLKIIQNIWPINRVGIGDDSKIINKNFEQDLHSRRLSEMVRGHRLQSLSKKPISLEEQLYNAKAFCKTKTGEVAMYLLPDVRSRFFSQLDNLMGVENWEEDDKPIIEASFTTLLRMLIYIKPDRRPGLGATSEGNIIAAWTNGKDRLTIECLSGDKVRWVLSCYIEEDRVSGAGEIPLTRLLAVLAPYNPERWFTDDSQKTRTYTR